MSKKNKDESIDDTILKMVLNKLSALQSEILTLQSRVQQLEVKSK